MSRWIPIDGKTDLPENYFRSVSGEKTNHTVAEA